MQIARSAPLQLYSSALVFSPENCIIRNTFFLSLLIRSLAFSADGQLLASAAQDKTLGLWESNTGDPRHILESHAAHVLSTTFSPDGNFVASGCSDGTVRLWDPVSGARIRTLEGHMDSFSAIAFSPNSLLLAVSSYGFTVNVWDVSSGKAATYLVWPFCVGVPDFVLPMRESFTLRLGLWDLVTDTLRLSFSPPKDSLYPTLDLSPDGQLMS
ncbi:WD40 repeat-like protein, partial [Aspergillus ellipticus CBS 707.79]